MAGLGSAILWGGTLAGTLDAVAATAFFYSQGVPPWRVWQNVASGLLGEQSLRGGGKTVMLGLLLHYAIALVVSSVFCLFVWNVQALLFFPVVTGASYGILVFLVMNFIVLPRSAMPKRRMTRGAIVAQVAFHVFLIGLPISISASFVAIH